MERRKLFSKEISRPALYLGFLASHNGTDMQAIIRAIEDGKLPNISAKALVSNNPNAPATDFAITRGIPTQIINNKTSLNPSLTIYDFFTQQGVNLVICSGYMKKIEPELYKNIPVLNVHPADTRKYGGEGMYGDIVHETVLKAGEIVTIPTIHLVTEDYDEGPIVTTSPVPILAEDTVSTLKPRVQVAEIDMYITLLQELASGAQIEGITLPSTSI